MARGGLVEGRGNHLAAHRALHFGHFLRAFVNQQHDQEHVGMVGGDRVRDVLQHDGLAGLGRRHQQAALTLADGRDQVDHACGQVFGRGVVALEPETIGWMERSQVFEQYLVLGFVRILEIDFVDFEEREVAFGFFRRADVALDGVARAQVEAAYLRGRDVDVIRSGEVGGVCRSQEAESVLQDLDHALADDVLALFCLGLEDREDQVGPGRGHTDHQD